jgi:hypothetical protein
VSWVNLAFVCWKRQHCIKSCSGDVKDSVWSVDF